MSNDNVPAHGMSAAERDVRSMMAEADRLGLPDNTPMRAHAGVLRTLLRDIEMWRTMVTCDIDKFSFDALMRLATLILDTIYPKDVFTDATLNRVIAEHPVFEMVPQNSGTVFVAMLRRLIADIEARDKEGEA